MISNALSTSTRSFCNKMKPSYSQAVYAQSCWILEVLQSGLHKQTFLLHSLCHVWRSLMYYILAICFCCYEVFCHLRQCGNLDRGDSWSLCVGFEKWWGTEMIRLRVLMPGSESFQDILEIVCALLKKRCFPSNLIVHRWTRGPKRFVSSG